MGVWPREELQASLKAMWAPCSANSSSVSLSRETGKAWGRDQGTQANRFQSNWGEKPQKESWLTGGTLSG